MLEVEVKYAVADFAAVEARLRDWDAAVVDDRRDRDTYFAPPDRDFAQTGEAFRLRCIGDHNFVTYKGPRQPGPTKTRRELELPLADGSATAGGYVTLFGLLRYQPVGTVEKRRRIYECDRGGRRLQICLDDVAGLGTFVELEVMATEADADAARAVVLTAAADLGLGPVEPRSYLGLLRAKAGVA